MGGFNPLEETKTLKENYTGFYRGVVRDNNDPLKIGRVKLEILPIFKDIPIPDLPWAQKAYINIPNINSWMWVFFEEGNIYNPVYFTTASPVLIEKSLTPIAESRGHPLVTGNEAGKTQDDNIAEEKETQAINNSENNKKFFPDEKNVNIGNYPDNNIYRFKSGIVIQIDDTPGNARIHIYHPTDAYIDINNEGLIHAHSHGKECYSDEDIKTKTLKNLEKEVGGNVSSVVGGSVLMDILGNVIINTQGLITINSATSVNIIAGGAITLTSGGIVSIN